jgi:UDPglucose 6-dehydrogenase
VALLGLSFKPNTDDLRGAPSLTIAVALNSLGVKVVGYDPVAGKAATKLTPDIQAVFDPYEALDGAHAAVVVTEWEEVRDMDPKKAASLMRDPKLIVDGRNALDAAASREAGLLCTGAPDVAMTGASPRPRRPRTVVTGGAGFIGSHLCERLLA